MCSPAPRALSSAEGTLGQYFYRNGQRFSRRKTWGQGRAATRPGGPAGRRSGGDSNLGLIPRSRYEVIQMAGSDEVLGRGHRREGASRQREGWAQEQRKRPPAHSGRREKTAVGGRGAREAAPHGLLCRAGAQSSWLLCRHGDLGPLPPPRPLPTCSPPPVCPCSSWA